MHKEFDAAALEAKWQAAWRKSGLYDTTSVTAQESTYLLVEWPYPSGNLHIGHWYAFAVPDIYARFERMNGKRVLFPMGFDAFGLPAENAAIKHGVNPREWTESNITKMREQLESMGNSFSWDMTASSTDPAYYKWTQWMFTKFFAADLAYRGTGVVNWCPGCHTVIANEQVIQDGGVDVCERCKTAVERKEMPQWMIGITKYADRLVDDLDDLDWPEHIKEAQRQWIGRSEGAEIDFTLSTDDTVTVFTTRPDTLYGATYMVLAPEHELLETRKDVIKNWDAVASYRDAAAQANEQDRLDASKEKTGVLVEGITATNPASGETIPVYIADYVLASYGTGAIMAVPAHDERDYAFATNFSLPVRTVVESNQNETTMPYVGGGTICNSAEFDGISSEEAKAAITEKVGGRMTNTYRLRDWSVGRQRYWGTPIPIVYDPEGTPHPVPKEHLPWILPEDVDFTPTGEPPLAKSQELLERTERIFGAGWKPEVETMDTFLDSSWYFLRYLDPTNLEMFADPAVQAKDMPVDIYFGGAEHTTMHLLYSRFWQKALYDLELTPVSEPYKHRVNRGLIKGPDGDKMSKSKGNVVDPDEQVRFVGADAVKMYLAFMGPYQGSNYPWDPNGVVGVRRFLDRVNGLQDRVSEAGSPDASKALHKMIAKMREDIPQYKFNTAISAMMTALNVFEKTGLRTEEYHLFLRAAAPFAPHLAEELWEQAGHTTSIHLEAYPEADPSQLVDDVVEIGVQINGKIRGSITIAPDASEDEAYGAATADAKLAPWLEEKTVNKVIYRPGKILNLVLEK